MSNEVGIYRYKHSRRYKEIDELQDYGKCVDNKAKEKCEIHKTNTIKRKWYTN